MNHTDIDETSLSISFLNALEYCPRRFYYECIRGEFLDNAHTVEGTQLHERSDSGQTTHDGDITVRRRVWVWSERLRLSGFADVVEEQQGTLIPIEYKKGKMGNWINNHIQLCAQALCLEEMRQIAIPVGYIFYSQSGRREKIPFDTQLRQDTEAAIKTAFTLIEQNILPPPLKNVTKRQRQTFTLHKKCHDCSLEPLCLPREINRLSADTEI
jgi:CRISPR-associated protein Cas4